MTVPRSEHSATLLTDGRVLLAGGRAQGDSLLSSAEIYDPATGAFSATGSMAAGRANPAAALLPDGRVLIAGGYCGTAAEVYDPSSGAFAYAGSLIEAQLGASATQLPSGKVLIANGETCDPLQVTAARAELYDPSTGAFAFAGPYAPTPGLYMSGGPIWGDLTPLADGRVLVSGDPIPQIYDPSSNSFQLSASEVYGAMYWHTATRLVTGQVLIAGGTDEATPYFANAGLYDPAADTFTAGASMHIPRALHTGSLLADGTVLIAGGETWITTGSLGYFGGSSATAELFDPSTRTFSETGGMSEGRAGHQATVLQNGSVLITGGTDWYPPMVGLGMYNWRVLSSAELFIPATPPVQSAQSSQTPQ